MERLIILLFTCIMMSCGSGTNKSTESKQNENALQAKWELTELEGDVITGERPIYLELSADHKVTGFVGCNRVMGSYQTSDGNQIRFENMATTRMSCPQIELEGQILEILDMVDRFKIQNGMVSLSAGEGSVLAVFRKMDESDIVNKYWKLKTLNDEPVVMDENQEREQFFMLRGDQTVNGFAGCNQFNGQYELKGEDQIKFNKNMAVTLKACPDVEVDERGFLDVFPAAEGYLLKGDDLTLLDEDGTALATFEAVYF